MKSAVTPEEFIDALFGEGWTQDQLPVFLEIVKGFDRDAKRYHEVRELLASRPGSFVASRKELYEVDELVDKARLDGLR